MVRDTIEEIHRISADLRPSILDDMGIIATIHSVCREFQEIQSKIQIETMIDMEEEELPESLKIVIYRVLQEALNNALRHSQADKVKISLKNTVNGFEMSVKDDGLGFDTERLLTKDDRMEGMGLSSMQERIELSGGFFDLSSQTGKGTTVRGIWNL
jgi:signal transduction histidine kinase